MVSPGGTLASMSFADGCQTNDDKSIAISDRTTGNQSQDGPPRHRYTKLIGSAIRRRLYVDKLVGR